MRRKGLLCLVWTSVILWLSDLAAGDAGPAILGSSELGQLRQFQSRLQPDPRPRLSTTQQQHILSDVQQHQRRYNPHNQDTPASQLVSFPGLSRQISPKSDVAEPQNFSSLAKYRVDRTKQQQQQQQHPHHHQNIQTLQNLQNPEKSDSLGFLQTAQTQRYQTQRHQQFSSHNNQQQQFTFPTSDSHESGILSPDGQLFQEQKLRLDEYYEKQRQLEQLKKQREQLILEQQEIKRQQELLRLQHLASLTSTTRVTPVARSTTSRPISPVTTSSPILVSSPASRRITPAESDLFLKAIATHQKKFTTTTIKPTTTTNKPETKTHDRVQEFSGTQEIPKDLLSLIQAQQPQLLAGGKSKPQIKIIYQTEKPSSSRSNAGKTRSSQYSSTSSTSSTSGSSESSASSATSEREILLKQLKQALAQSDDEGNRNVTTRDLVLPNGNKIQVIKAPNGLSSIVPNDGASQFQTVTQALETSASTTVTTTTIRPAKAILDELTKGVLPPGADFEVLRHKDDGKLEEVGKTPIQNQPGKKVTFVVLEEQPDGSYKVQGVKGNSGKENAPDVQSIVDRIKKGEIKLPPRSSQGGKLEKAANLDVVSSTEATSEETHEATTATREVRIEPTTFRPSTGRFASSPSTTGHKDSSSSAEYFPYVTVSPNSVSPSDNYVTSASTKSSHVYNSLINFSTTPRTASSRYEGSSSHGSSRHTTPSSQESSRYTTPSSQESSRYTTQSPTSLRHETSQGPTRTTFQSSSRQETGQELARFTTAENPSSRYVSSQESSRFTTPSHQSSHFEDNQSSRYQNPSTSSPIFQDNQSSRYQNPSTSSPIFQDNQSSSYQNPSTSSPIFQDNQSSRYQNPSTSNPLFQDNQSSRYQNPSTSSPIFQDNQSSRYQNPSTSSPIFQDNQSSRYQNPSTSSPIFQDNQSSRYQNPSISSSSYEDSQSSVYQNPTSSFESSEESLRFTSPGNPSSRYEENSSRYTTSSGFPRGDSTPTASPINDVFSSTSATTFTTTFAPQTASYVHFTSKLPGTSATSSGSNYNAASENLVLDDFHSSRVTVPSFLESTQNTIQIQESMTNLMRREGLFAMAKYLRQSGLDTVLNETGPYTIFVPTDKAFRSLLVQLGGPEKAEQKFRENPRLLSGLLLHHVIPGAFRIDSLQDEMTGVSLAGTQLRVNVYDMHDHEWNDVKVTTINGAKVAPNKRDIEIPQGVAHAIDRVMFPLPVGDLTQTLQADRERRFGTFLKILHASGLEETLAGTKTFTVFAPTDAAFASAASQNGRAVWTETDGTEAAKDIISRHVIPTTLYTGGMRYYHQRDTLRPQVSLSIHKNGGRVRVNEAQVVTHNVPATNGVIHAIDGVL